MDEKSTAKYSMTEEEIQQKIHLLTSRLAAIDNRCVCLKQLYESISDESVFTQEEKNNVKCRFESYVKERNELTAHLKDKIEYYNLNVVEVTSQLEKRTSIIDEALAKIDEQDRANVFQLFSAHHGKLKMSLKKSLEYLSTILQE